MSYVMRVLLVGLALALGCTPQLSSPRNDGGARDGGTRGGGNGDGGIGGGTHDDGGIGGTRDGGDTPDGSVPDGAVPALQLTITAAAANLVPPASDPRVMVQATQADSGGTTSLRLSANKATQANPYPVGAPNSNRVAPPSVRTVRMRDRDLGQTFVTGAHGFVLDTIYLRLGPSSDAVLAGAPGAAVVLQLFAVDGTPTLNDSGTPGFLSMNGQPVFDRAKSPQLDDYLEGERYTTIATATGTLPATLAANDYLALALVGAPVTLAPHTGYAFLLGFVTRAPDRALALANAYFGGYAPDGGNALVGHGIRREGGSGATAAPEFQPDLPDDLATRLGQPPGTLGFPDVDTWRDLFFTVTAVNGSQR